MSVEIQCFRISKSGRGFLDLFHYGSANDRDADRRFRGMGGKVVKELVSFPFPLVFSSTVWPEHRAALISR